MFKFIHHVLYPVLEHAAVCVQASHVVNTSGIEITIVRRIAIRTQSTIAIRAAL